MTTSDDQRPLAKIRSAAICAWLALETVGWMIVYYAQAPLVYYYRWRFGRLRKQSKAIRLEFERIRKVVP